MGSFLSYCIVSGLVLLAMYAVYRVAMAGDNQHAYNRGVLLAIYLVSFTALPVAGLLRSLHTGAVAEPVSAATGFVTLNMNAITESVPDTPLWSKALLWIFIAGMLVVSVKTILTWERIARLIRRGEKIARDGYTLVLTADPSVAPFSWYRYMVMSRDDYDTCGEAITLHEARHIACRHWIDLLVAQAVIIVNWFNPAAWLMRGQLMLVHEYQADNAVIDNNINPKEYQMLLIKKAVGAKFPSLANSLNHSKLKKRITMMYKSKSDTRARFKALALAPAAVAAILVAGISPVRAAISTIETTVAIDSKDSDKKAGGEISAANFTRKVINGRGATNVVLSLNVPGKSLTVDDATMKVAAGTYTSDGMTCEMIDGNAKIIATFSTLPLTDITDDSSITLRVNGSDVTLPLSRADIVVDYASASASDNLPYQLIYIDGREALDEELHKLDPATIESMTVEKDKNAIYIVLKKK